MKPLLTKALSRQIDQKTIVEYQKPECVLMEHAALAVVDCVCERFHSRCRGLVIVGGGNNGADALAVSRILWERGIPTDVVLFKDPSKAGGALAAQYQSLLKCGGQIIESFPSDVENYDFLIDGLFGTGLDRNVEGASLECIEKINQLEQIYKISIDVPSGLDADTGVPLGSAVRADRTVTLGHHKQGLVTGQAANYVGGLSLHSIQIVQEVKSKHFLVEGSDVLEHLPVREPCSHKGSFGQVFIWASQPHMEGACLLASLGALRSGAGLVSIVGREAIDSIRTRANPEVMCQPVPKDFWSGPSKANQILVMGPGIGTGEQAMKDVESALNSNWPLVLDADALNLIAQKKFQEVLKNRKAPVIVTPHPGEATRLLGCDVPEIESDRYAAVLSLSQQLGQTILLKGRGTLVCESDQVYVVNNGNPIQAKGGSGDVLSGMIGALWGQGVSPLWSALGATWLHGASADWLLQRKGQSFTELPSDIADSLRFAFTSLHQRGKSPTDG